MTRPPRIDVSILVVSYNTREFTLAALSSIARETKTASYEIIAVDNASTDGSAQAIAAHPARPELIALNENIGFGSANNLAAEQARGDYILLLNPDTEVTDRAIDRLVAYAKTHRRPMIWGGRTLFADGTLNPASCWQRMTLWNLFCRAAGLAAVFKNRELFNGEALGGWQRDTVREVDIVSGCFLLIPRSIWMALGGFDPDYFMYGEEADLCLRAKKIGARPVIVPEATIIHHGGASEKARSEKLIKLLAAKATLVRRHFISPLRGPGLVMLALWPLSRWIAHSLTSAGTGKAAHREAATVWRDVWMRRSEWQHGYGRTPGPAIQPRMRAPALRGIGEAA